MIKSQRTSGAMSNINMYDLESVNEYVDIKSMLEGGKS